MGDSDPHPHHTNEFTLCSWNPTGSSKTKMNWFSEYCNMTKTKLAMVQEHFKTSTNSLGYFRKELKNYNMNCKIAIRKDDEMRGRASRGLLQLSCKETVMDMVPIIMSSYRLQALKLYVGPKMILCINAYFPVDDKVNTEELDALLTEI